MPGSARVPLRLPAVEPAEAVGTPSGPPPLLVLVAADGAISLAAPPASWPELATFDPRPRARSIALRWDLYDLAIAARRNGWTPAQTLEHVGQPSERTDTLSDEPPADEANAPDASDPATGQLGNVFSLGYRKSPWRHDPEDDVMWPARAASIAGTVVSQLAPGEPALVLADPAAPATTVVEVISATKGLLAVNQRGAVRPLRLQIPTATPPDVRDPIAWTEVRVTRDGLEIEAVPGDVTRVPWRNGSLDAVAMGHALDAVRQARRRDPAAPVDIIVDGGVDTAALVSVLVALELEGVRTVGLGTAPDAKAIAAEPGLGIRGHRIRRFGVDRLAVAGDLPSGPAHRAITAAVPALRDCYEDRLAQQPELAGTIDAEIDIDGHGTPTAHASGVDDELDRCIERVLGQRRFGTPIGGTQGTLRVQFIVAPDVL